MTNLLKPGANVIFDGQWGSTGKGKLAAYLAAHSELSYATADFQPNAGHTVVIGGRSFMTKTIPSSFVNRDAQLMLSPAATINVDTLLKEIEQLGEFRVSDRLVIHPHSGIVTQEDIDEEQQTMGGIASTAQGVGAALARKIKRKALLAKDEPRLQQWVRDGGRKFDEMRWMVGSKARVALVETAQGFDLSLNHGMAYPYVTSRDVTPASALSNVGLPIHSVGHIWASLRCHPIRVGDLWKDGVKIGTSGPYYPDQRELTWDAVANGCGAPSLCELTTVTKRVRRVFSWSDIQFRRMLQICGPTHLFLNFANYLDWRANNATRIEDLAGLDKISDFVEKIEKDARRVSSSWSPRVRLLGTGPSDEHMISL